jgi:hypothetical protein
MEIKKGSTILPLPYLQSLASDIERIKPSDMMVRGYRAYHIKTRFYKNHYSFLQKKLGLDMVIGGDHLLYVKTIPVKLKV